MRIFRVTPSDQRRSLYLAGIGLSGIGLALFLSIFVTLAAHLTDLDAIRARGGSIAFRAVAGLFVAGAGFGAMAAALHAASVSEHPPDVEHDGPARRPDRDRELLRRVGEDDVRLFDDPRRWPKLSLPRRRASIIASSEAAQMVPAQTTEPASIGVSANAVVVKIRCRECRKLSAEEANYCEHCGRRL